MRGTLLAAWPVMRVQQGQFEILLFLFLGFLVSVYLGLFQLNIFSAIWDPIFFSTFVLKSPLSRSLPVPDALLGAAGYFCEGITLKISRNDRLGSGSWMSFLYCFIAMGMAATSVFLIFYQADILRHGCTLCLLSAGISIGLCIPAMQELISSWRLFKRRTMLGQPKRVALRFFVRSDQVVSSFEDAA